MEMAEKLLITNVRPMGGKTVDILIEDGRISRMEPAIAVPGVAVEDGGGWFHGLARLLPHGRPHQGEPPQGRPEGAAEGRGRPRERERPASAGLCLRSLRADSNR